MKPIRPEEIIDQLETIIPPIVIEAVNNMLKSKYRGNGPIKVLQKDIVEEIIRLDNTITSNKIFDNKWMDFEEIYKKHGWKIDYEKPHYTETFEAYFTFTAKK